MSVMDTHVDELENILRGAEGGEIDITQLEERLHEAEEILAEMKIELHSVTNQAKKAEYTMKMQNFTRQIEKHRKTLLISNSNGQVPAGGRAAAANATATNQRSLEVLKKAHQQLAETEEVGMQTLEQLAKQKETIRNIQKNTDDVNANVSYSNKLLTRMGKWWRG